MFISSCNFLVVDGSLCVCVCVCLCVTMAVCMFVNFHSLDFPDMRLSISCVFVGVLNFLGDAGSLSIYMLLLLVNK